MLLQQASSLLTDTVAESLQIVILELTRQFKRGGPRSRRTVGEGGEGRTDQWVSVGAQSSVRHCGQLCAVHLERPEGLQVPLYKERMAEGTDKFTLIYALPDVFLCGNVGWYAFNMHNFYALVCQSDE